MARANEKVNAQGSRDVNRTFMAFKRAEASSPDWPPDKNAIPDTAAGTARKRHPTVASATPSTVSCLGKSIKPSSIPRWVSITHGNHSAPLCKAGAHSRVISRAVAIPAAVMASAYWLRVFLFLAREEQREGAGFEEMQC